MCRDWRRFWAFGRKIIRFKNLFVFTRLQLFEKLGRDVGSCRLKSCPAEVGVIIMMMRDLGDWPFHLFLAVNSERWLVSVLSVYDGDWWPAVVEGA